MAITSTIIGTLAAGGGETFATTFAGKGSQTKTVGQSGKIYVVYARTWGESATSIAVSGTVIASGNDPTSPGKFEGFGVFPGPVTFNYTTGTLSSAENSRAFVFCAETNTF